MSSTNKTANYQLSQFVGTDIPSILNDYNGDMRKIDSAIKENSIAGGDNATAIAELQATTGRMSTEMNGINATVNSLSGKVVSIESKIPANASADNKLITYEDIPEIPSISELEDDVEDMQAQINNVNGKVQTIQSCIPASASEDNKLVTDSKVSSLENDIEIVESRITDVRSDISRLDSYIENIENHRFREIYHTQSSSTYLEDLDAIWKAFRDSLTTISANNIYTNINALLISDGSRTFRCDGVSSGGAQILQFTAHDSLGLNFEMISLNLNLNESFGDTVVSATMAKVTFGTSGHQIVEVPINNKYFNGFMLAGTYIPSHI